jgi:hypothetical protein
MGCGCREGAGEAGGGTAADVGRLPCDSIKVSMSALIAPPRVPGSSSRGSQAGRAAVCSVMTEASVLAPQKWAAAVLLNCDVSAGLACR